MRVAILGGSFDPIHNGHIQIAKYALKRLPIDEVWFMPTMDTPLKDRTLTAYEHRVNMIRLAIYPYRRMKLCQLEKREGKSYTIDTVKKLKKRYPMYTFCWLIGSDQVAQLDKWKDIDTLMELVPFYVFARESDTISTTYPVQTALMPLIDVSSTEIRNGFKLNMLPDQVRNYIAKHVLYLESMVRSAMSEHRYEHSCSVAALCVELAKVHHVNERQAYLAGMMHDVCKQWDKEQSKIWMKYLEPDLQTEHPNVWHGYIASKYVKRYYHIDDKEVLFAIRNHVKGSMMSKLAMILYVSDKLDPARGYDSSETIALCKRELKQGYQEVMRQQQEYLKQKL